MNTLRVAPVVLTLAAAAAAQQAPIYDLPARGIMPAFPAGVIMSPGDEILKKKSGMPFRLVDFDTPGPVADYSVQAIMAALPTGVSPLAIDAMSSGNDTLPLVYHSSGKFWISQPTGPEASGWAVLYLTMEADPEVGDAVVGYYFDNPSFPHQLQNGIYYELIPSDFPGGSLPSSLDIAMGLLEDNNGTLEAGASEVIDRIYFSLTPDSANHLFNELYQGSALLAHAQLANYSPPGGSYTGATIFEARFNTNGVCVQVLVCEDYDSLGLPPEIYPDADIDALAVSRTQAVPLPNGTVELQPATLQYVFSLEAPSSEELRVAANVWTNNQTYVRRQGPLRGNDGDWIVGGGGTLQGMVRAICARDPENALGGASAYAEPANVTTDWGLSLSLAVRNTAAFAQVYPVDQFELKAVVTGWAGLPPQDSLVCLCMEVAGFTFCTTPQIRSATAAYHEFTVQVPGMQWWDSLGSIPNALNRYTFYVQQVGISMPGVTESFRSNVLRTR